jgi:hypothetical protein
MDTASQIEENRRNAKSLFRDCSLEHIVNLYKEKSRLDAGDWCKISLVSVSQCLFSGNDLDESGLHPWFSDSHMMTELVELLGQDTRRPVIHSNLTHTLELKYAD